MLPVVVTHASHMCSALADLLPQQIGGSAPADGGFVLKQPRIGLVRRVTWHKLPGERTLQAMTVNGVDVLQMYHSSHPPREEPKLPASHPSVQPSQPVAAQVWWETF